MHLLLVDGSGFVFRAFHALPQLTRRSDGLPVFAGHSFAPGPPVLSALMRPALPK